jgi:hypothetical protein
MNELSALPDCFAAGTTVSYRRSLSEYPATAGWELRLYLAGVSVLSELAAADGADHVVTLTAAETAPLGAGTYTWEERVSQGSEVHTVASGTVVVEPDIATATAGDLQSWEEKTLVIVEAALSDTLATADESYQIHGRAVSKYDKRELLKIRDSLLVRIQRRKRGGKLQTILYRFTGAR